MLVVNGLVKRFGGFTAVNNVSFRVEQGEILGLIGPGLDPKLPPVIKMIGEEFDKVKPGVAIRSAHVGMAASNTYLFMTDVLPRAIKKYGGVDPDALRKAALEVDVPEGGTMLGFGVKFPAEGSQMAGQNERSFPVVIQYVDDKSYVVWPKSQAQREAVLPLPKGTTFSNQ